MLRRVFSFFVVIPLAVLLIALAIANRHQVELILDPFRPDAPALSLVLPFYAYLFAALALGVIAGGLSVWMGQGRWRRAARVSSQEARRWRGEADRLVRERDDQLAQTKELITAGN